MNWLRLLWCKWVHREYITLTAQFQCVTGERPDPVILCLVCGRIHG